MVPPTKPMVRFADTRLPMAPLLLFRKAMRSTFFQKVLICMIAAFFAACLIQWGKIFVEGADDALNAGYKKDATSLTGP